MATKMTVDLSEIEKLIAIAKEYDITYLALFGSFARGEARSDSDIDLAVRFGHPITLFDLVGVRLEMQKIVGRPVDLIPIDQAYAFIRRAMQKDLIVLYEAEATSRLAPMKV
jgi:predicted nucleotidyltransferase